MGCVTLRRVPAPARPPPAEAERRNIILRVAASATMMIRGALTVLLLLGVVRDSPDYAHGFAPPLVSHEHSRIPSATSRRRASRRRRLVVSQRAPQVALQASPPLTAFTAASAPLGSVSVLAMVILIHEMGHFLSARAFGINVDEFR